MKFVLITCLLLSCIIGCSNIQPLGHDIIGGYDQFKWGTSLEEMRNVLDLKFNQELPGAELWNRKTPDSLAGVEVLIGFGFVDGKLGMILFMTGSESDFHIMMKSVEDRIGPSNGYREKTKANLWYDLDENTMAASFSNPSGETFSLALYSQAVFGSSLFPLE